MSFGNNLSPELRIIQWSIREGNITATVAPPKRGYAKPTTPRTSHKPLPITNLVISADQRYRTLVCLDARHQAL